MMKQLLCVFLLLSLLLCGCGGPGDAPVMATEPVVTEAPTEPPTEPTEPPDGPDRPQTGQTTWPVPVLAMMGMLLVLAGLGFCKAGKREDYEV